MRTRIQLPSSHRFRIGSWQDGPPRCHAVKLIKHQSESLKMESWSALQGLLASLLILLHANCQEPILYCHKLDQGEQRPGIARDGCRMRWPICYLKCMCWACASVSDFITFACADIEDGTGGSGAPSDAHHERPIILQYVHCGVCAEDLKSAGTPPNLPRAAAS